MVQRYLLVRDISCETAFISGAVRVVGSEGMGLGLGFWNGVMQVGDTETLSLYQQDRVAL